MLASLLLFLRLFLRLYPYLCIHAVFHFWQSGIINKTHHTTMDSGLSNGRASIGFCFSPILLKSCKYHKLSCKREEEISPQDDVCESHVPIVKERKKRTVKCASRYTFVVICTPSIDWNVQLSNGKIHVLIDSNMTFDRDRLRDSQLTFYKNHPCLLLIFFPFALAFASCCIFRCLLFLFVLASEYFHIVHTCFLHSLMLHYFKKASVFINSIDYTLLPRVFHAHSLKNDSKFFTDQKVLKQKETLGLLEKKVLIDDNEFFRDTHYSCRLSHTSFHSFLKTTKECDYTHFIILRLYSDEKEEKLI